MLIFELAEVAEHHSASLGQAHVRLVYESSSGGAAPVGHGMQQIVDQTAVLATACHGIGQPQHGRRALGQQ